MYDMWQAVEIVFRTWGVRPLTAGEARLQTAQGLAAPGGAAMTR